MDPSWGLDELGEGELRVMVRFPDMCVDGGIIPKRETGPGVGEGWGSDGGGG